MAASFQVCISVGCFDDGVGGGNGGGGGGAAAAAAVGGDGKFLAPVIHLSALGKSAVRLL